VRMKKLLSASGDCHFLSRVQSQHRLTSRAGTATPGGVLDGTLGWDTGTGHWDGTLGRDAGTGHRDGTLGRFRKSRCVALNHSHHILYGLWIAGRDTGRDDFAEKGGVGRVIFI
jgi:hypothetical protein